MKAEEKLARQRLSVLELAESLSNVSEACRQRGMSRSQFYEYKKRFQEKGLAGLKDLPPIPKKHPFRTSPEVVERILEKSMEHPAWGCVKLSQTLKLEGISVSSPTIQNILIKHGMGQKYQRLLELERRAVLEGLELSEEQFKAVAKHNPVFRERHIETTRPGELLSADTYYVGNINGLGKLYLHSVVDCYGSYAFGFLHTSKQPEAAVAVLHNDALPFYQERGLTVEAVLTDNGREFCGKQAHPYELYLELNDIEHRRTKVKSPHTNGFVERFHKTVKYEFFDIAFRQQLYDTVESLQRNLDTWLEHYNTERPHQGYRNMGKRPVETIDSFSESVREEA
jgi:transposase InsO family protein